MIDNRVVGFIEYSITTSTFLGAGEKGFIDHLAIAQASRRKGYGEMLMKYAVQHLQRVGMNRVEVEVGTPFCWTEEGYEYDSNEPARNLYKKMGFVGDGCLMVWQPGVT